MTFTGEFWKPVREYWQLDGGHFLLESKLDAAVGYIRPFLERTLS